MPSPSVFTNQTAFQESQAPRAGETPKQGRLTSGGGGSGLGIFKQTEHTHIHRS